METVEKIKLTEKQIADVENGKIVAIKATWEEFWEFAQTNRYKNDYHNGEILIMGSAHFLHEILVSNLTILLGNYFKSKGYLIAGSNLGIARLDKDSYYNPDITIIKGLPELKNKSEAIITNPFIIIEVLSESTYDYDMLYKRNAYQNLNSLEELVFIDRFEKIIYVFKRSPSPNVWIETIYNSNSDVVIIDTFSFVLGDIFNDLPNIS